MQHFTEHYFTVDPRRRDLSITLDIVGPNVGSFYITTNVNGNGTRHQLDHYPVNPNGPTRFICEATLRKNEKGLPLNGSAHTFSISTSSPTQVTSYKLKVCIHEHIHELTVSNTINHRSSPSIARKSRYRFNSSLPVTAKYLNHFVIPVVHVIQPLLLDQGEQLSPLRVNKTSTHQLLSSRQIMRVSCM